MINIGLQLYTVREALEHDFAGTLRKISELGYRGVEFAGFFGQTAEQVKQLLSENSLTAIGAHTPYDRLLHHLDEEIAFNKAIGNRYLVMPYLAEGDRNRWDEVIADLAVIGQRCHEEGMILCYHNHEFELTQRLGDITVLDAIYDSVAASLLQVELDTCWVSFAGYDPLEYISKYSGRLPLLHLKDMVKKEDGTPETVELGRGIIPVKSIADTAVANHVEWIIVEQDYCAGNALDSIAVSMDWVRRNLIKGEV